MRKKFLKLVCALGTAAVLALGMGTAAMAADYLQYETPEKFVQMYETHVNIDFMGNSKGLTQCWFYNNRLCVPLRATVEALGGTLQTDSEAGEFIITIEDKTKRFKIAPSEGNRVTTLYVDGVGYMYMYDLLNAFDMTPTFNIDDNLVTIYKKQTTMPPDLLQGPGETAQTAYLRLEDIVADGLDYSGRKYSDKNCEKLMTIGEYLWLRGQEYYIAWIPFYLNPPYGVSNELTDNTNLYNSCFMYTLDFLSEHGGHMGVHGYTHQYGNAKSADGWEWGVNTPYTVTEQMQRLILARQTAERFGFKTEFFEFPHYGATTEQLNMAERYYDVIYQSHPDTAKAYNIASRVTDGKKTFYIPTPADYIHSVFDTPFALDRLTQSKQKGWEISIFYHPALDFAQIQYTNDGYVRSWNMPSDAVLPQLVNHVMSLGYTFDGFDAAKYQNR
ncbi:MAG: DUF2334 domain-containing protein [Firmicutes bacterium]|nr:DUF2334 domain-containing protein [Bacillota bacterium]